MGSPNVVLCSTITCPVCHHAAREQMPTYYCQARYDCRGCGRVLAPKPEDCCVYCSYGTVPCPPVQIHGKACCNRPPDPKGAT
ncbi:MAG: hypothetical protein OXU20_39215 [Myxococcales bacterium]|nr:hypothetical protein [Myxococcales bacterium]MDD9967872.1 hypothetical protein [Myxococcales bacterium]